MGCCGNKTCGRMKAEATTPEAPMPLLDDSLWAVSKLLDTIKNAGSGLCADSSSGCITELITVISTIVAENVRLKDLLFKSASNAVKVTNDGATVFFGPDGEYSLFLAAATKEARSKLAANLIAAGKELQQKKTVEHDPRQQQLPFNN